MAAKQSEIKSGAVLSYATVAFNALAGLLYTPWMISCIGADDYGLYTLALSAVSFFIMDFGLSDTITRFLSRYYRDGDAAGANRFLAIVYKLFFIIAAVISAVLICVFINLDVIYANLGEEQLGKLHILFAIVGMYSVIALPFIPTQGTLRANERFVDLNGALLFQKIATVCLIVICLALGLGVFALVTVNACTTLISSCLQYFLVKKHTDAKALMRYWDAGEARAIFDFSIWITLAQICQRFIFVVGPSVIAILSSSWEVALFGLASSLESYVYSVAGAINGLFMPKVARTADDAESINLLMRRIGHLQVLVIGIILTGFIAFGMRFIECWMGDSYQILYWCVLALIIPSFLDTPQTIGDIALITEGYVKERAVIYAAMAVINLFVMSILVPSHGALGACLSICIAYLVRTASKDYLYVKRLGIRIGSFLDFAYSKWALLAFPLTLVALAASLYCPLDGWPGLALLIALYTFAYIALMSHIVFTDEEKALLLPKLNRVLRK